MTNQIKTEAETVKIGLALGLLPKADVIAWADNMISASETVDNSIIETALSADNSVNEICDKLSGVTGLADRHTVIRRLFEMCVERYRSGALSAAEINHIVSDILEQHMEHDTETYSQLSQLTEYYDIAEEGYIKDPATAFQEVIGFISNYK